MKKKIVTCFVFIALYILAMAFALQVKPTSAANNGTITLTEGESKTITLPKKQKYYTSSDSNSNASSSASYKSRKVKITGLSEGTTIVTITSTKKKKYKYTVVVNAKPADPSMSVVTEEPKNVEGACPNCKKKNHLQTMQVTYARNAVKTGYLKEPLVSCKEFRRVHFSDKLSEDEICELVKNWKGVILSKFKDTSVRDGYYNFAYDILLPCEYGGLNNISLYQRELFKRKGIDSPYKVIDPYSLADNTDNFSHYLTEWTLEEVIAEPAKQMTVNTEVVECTNCGYKFIK